MSLPSFSKVKELAQLVVVATSVGLAMRFILNVGDPTFGTVPATHVHFMYSNLRVVVDALYWATNLAMVPVTQVFAAIPKTTWGEYASLFPITPSFLVGDWIQQQLLLIPPFPFIDKYMLTEDPRAWMPGVIDWRALVGAVAYPVVLPLLQSAFDAAKQLVLTVLVEATHSHKKEDRFKQALKAKNAELQKFNTDFENLHQEIHSLSEAVTIDELTKAYNRRFFSEKVRELFQKQKQTQRLMSILMIDIDHFKGVNDTYGHQVGDEVLVFVTQVLKRLTPTQGFCCRYGGEEFSILLPNMEVDEATRVAEGIRQEIMKVRFPSQAKLRSTVSIGLATADFARYDVKQKLYHFEDLIRLADDALYQAKTQGRNQVRRAQIV